MPLKFRNIEIGHSTNTAISSTRVRRLDSFVRPSSGMSGFTAPTESSQVRRKSASVPERAME